MNVLTLPVGFYEENCYVVWDTAPGPAAVIDPGGKPEAILEALREHGLTLSHILLTHGHFDHFLAAPALQRVTGAPLFMHRLDRDSLSCVPAPMNIGYTAPADIRTADGGDTVAVGALTLTFRHMPGHSPGSCFILCEDVIFSGDTLFHGDVGRVDLKGSDPEAMKRTLAEIAAWPGDARVCPGHEEETTLAEEKARNPYLRPPYQL